MNDPTNALNHLINPSAEVIAKSTGCLLSSNRPADPFESKDLDWGLLEGELKSKAGLVGYLHAAEVDYGYLVLGYGSIFNVQFLSLVPGSPEIQNQFKNARRHDRIRIKGSVKASPDTQPHILVDSMEILDPYKDPQGSSKNQPFEAQFDLSRLPESGSLLAKVHAQLVDGSTMVVEVGDRVVPVVVPKSSRQKATEIYRGDKILFHYKIARSNRRPPHLVLDSSKADHLKIVEALVDCHGIKGQKLGRLVKYSKSPQTTVDVYALEIKDENGLARHWTILNDIATEDDVTLFLEINKKLAEIFDLTGENLEAGRNHWVAKNLCLKVNGTFNMVSKIQANPQIFIDDVSAIAVAPCQE